MSSSLTLVERQRLLAIARAAILAAVNGAPPPVLEAETLPASLRVPAATFVTLHIHGALRGCIGGLEAHWPLYEDVQRHAAQSATQDYRFPPVTPAEAPQLEIEISILTPPQPLTYAEPGELPGRLRPQVDGVTLTAGGRRATFLPQVWEREPDPARFLSRLCEKMGLAADTWRRAPLTVEVYQVEEFSDAEPRQDAS